MKKICFLICACSLFIFQTVSADEIGFSYDSKTGDKELDLSLGRLNVEAKADMDNFINELSIEYGVEKGEVRDLSKKIKDPADIYMAFKISRVTNKPIKKVIREYESNKKKGWGVIAKNLGIKPGSKEFHALKHDASGVLVASKSNSAGKKTKNKGKTKDKKK